jgi:Leucine-rich repeat (LRR) protein
LFKYRSYEAVELAHIIKLLGVIPDVCVEEYIVNFFKELKVQKMMVYQLDPTLARFTQLKVLNLSFNNITRIECLPPNLEELYLNGNQVNEVAMNPNKPITSLIHLGLSMN